MAATNSLSVPAGSTGVTAFDFTQPPYQPRARTVEIDNSAGTVDVFVNCSPLHAAADRILVAAGRSKAWRSQHQIVKVFADSAASVYPALLAD